MSTTVKCLVANHRPPYCPTSGAARSKSAESAGPDNAIRAGSPSQRSGPCRGFRQPGRAYDIETLRVTGDIQQQHRLPNPTCRQRRRRSGASPHPTCSTIPVRGGRKRRCVRGVAARHEPYPDDSQQSASLLGGRSSNHHLIGLGMVLQPASVMRCQNEPMWVPHDSVDRLTGATGRPGCGLSLAGPR